VNSVRPVPETAREPGDGLVARLRAEWDDDWLTRHERCPAAQAPQRLRHLADEIASLAAPLVARICGGTPPPASPQLEPYLQRLHGCLSYHWRRLGRDGRLPFTRLIAHLLPDPPAKGVHGDLLAEVVLAQALELGEPRAAEVFEVDFMPVVRGTARSVGGEKAVEVVENFAAELVLPREGRGPRIATYAGRTGLAHWLVPVVVNYWRTTRRQRPTVSLSLFPDPPAPDVAEGEAEAPCEGLLRPIFAHTVDVLTPEDRLLLQMLVLEGVPQKELAHSLGLNSGTITRRRQKAIGAMLERLRQLTAGSRRPGDVANCLQAILAGDDPELRGRLAAVLAGCVRGGAGGGE
jgi:hypothetical protein